MFLLDPQTPGVELRKIKKLGLKPMDINEIFLTDVRVPRADTIGEVNKGWLNVLKSFDRERCLLSAVNVGASQACFDLALRYAKQRQQFGKPISGYHPIKKKLVDMDMEISASRMLVLSECVGGRSRNQQFQKFRGSLGSSRLKPTWRPRLKVCVLWRVGGS